MLNGRASRQAKAAWRVKRSFAGPGRVACEDQFLRHPGDRVFVREPVHVDHGEESAGNHDSGELGGKTLRIEVSDALAGRHRIEASGRERRRFGRRYAVFDRFSGRQGAGRFNLFRGEVDAGEPGAGAVHRARQYAGAGAGVEHAQAGADDAGFLQLPVERSRVDVAVFRVVRRRAAEIEPVAVVDRIKREFHENHLRFPKYIPDRAGMQSKRGKKGERA